MKARDERNSQAAKHGYFSDFVGITEQVFYFMKLRVRAQMMKQKLLFGAQVALLL